MENVSSNLTLLTTPASSVLHSRFSKLVQCPFFLQDGRYVCCHQPFWGISTSTRSSSYAAPNTSKLRLVADPGKKIRVGNQCINSAKQYQTVFCYSAKLRCPPNLG
jgi:hypothetical protein